MYLSVLDSSPPYILYVNSSLLLYPYFLIYAHLLQYLSTSEEFVGRDIKGQRTPVCLMLASLLLIAYAPLLLLSFVLYVSPESLIHLWFIPSMCIRLFSSIPILLSMLPTAAIFVYLSIGLVVLFLVLDSCIYALLYSSSNLNLSVVSSSPPCLQYS